jgi:DNA polymerase III subunit gamma/tau
MAHLIEKLRPRTLDDVVANQATMSRLNEWLLAEEKHPTILFHGPIGCCKTTLGHLTAKELGAPAGSFHCHETEVARYTVETFRDITDRMGRGIFVAKAPHWDVYLFDEAQFIPPVAQAMLYDKAANPPQRVILMFITSEPEKLAPALRSRCQEFEVQALTRSETVKLLQRACEAEKVQLEEEVLKGIAKEVQGNPRDALIRLGEVLNFEEARRKEGNDE